MEGFIKLHRKTIKWEWFTDPNTAHLFLYFLLRANYEDTKWRGIEIKRGQFVTSLKNISNDTGLTIMQVRTSLKKLKATQEVTQKTTARNTIITVKNYDKYQDNNTNCNTIITRKYHDDNTIITTDKKNKKEKNINLSLSINGEKKVTDDEREILKNYVKKTAPKVSNVNAYVRKIIENNDHIEILKTEKARIERAKARASIPPPVKPPPPTESEIQAGLELLRKSIIKGKKHERKNANYENQTEQRLNGENHLHHRR